MKGINAISCSALLFAMQSAFAIPPVTISDPVPAITSNYAPGSTTTLIYTITNNVPKGLPLTVSGISAPVTRVQVPNDCNNVLPIGPQTCNIGISIAPTFAEAGNTITQSLSVNYQGRTPLVKEIAFSVSSSGPAPVPVPVPIIPTGLFTAAGQDSTGTLPPLLGVSMDGGQTWEFKTNLVPSGAFNATNCTGSGLSATCIAAGNDSTFAPLLTISIDGGNNWTVVTNIPDLTTLGSFTGTSCTESGSSAICIAVGVDFDINASFLVAGTGTSGTDWAVQPIIQLGSFLNGTSCTGDGSSTFCIAVGQNPDGTILLVASIDGGDFGFQTPPPPGTGSLSAVSCTGSGTSTICAAGGSSGAGPLLITTTNEGSGCVAPTITGGVVPAGAQINATSCTGSGPSAVCIAAGQDVGANKPFLVVSTGDSIGSDWNIITIPTIPSGEFNAASCTGSGSSAVCIATGHDSTNNRGLLVASLNGGQTWEVKTIAGNQTNTFLVSASCTGDGASAVCIAAGVALTRPVLVVSTPGGNSWTAITPPGTPATGSYNGTGATVGSPAFNFKRFGVKNALENEIKKPVER